MGGISYPAQEGGLQVPGQGQDNTDLFVPLLHPPARPLQAETKTIRLPLPCPEDYAKRQAAPSFSMTKGLQVCADYSKVPSPGLRLGTHNIAVANFQAFFFLTLLTLNSSLLPGQAVTTSAHRLSGSQGQDSFLLSELGLSAILTSLGSGRGTTVSFQRASLSSSGKRCVTQGHHRV